MNQRLNGCAGRLVNWMICRLRAALLWHYRLGAIHVDTEAVFGLMAMVATVTSPDCVPIGLLIVSELEEEVSFDVAARKLGAEEGVALASFK
jgi:hypothetical protein